VQTNLHTNVHLSGRISEYEIIYINKKRGGGVERRDERVNGQERERASEKKGE